MPITEDAIRERAYHLWNNAGRPDGSAEAFWLDAQREILVQSLAQIANVAPAQAKKPAKAKAATSRKRKAA